MAVYARTGELEHWLWRMRTLGASQASASMDIRDYDGMLAIGVESVGCAGGTPTCVVKLQHSVDNSVWADVPGGTLASFGTTSKGEGVNFNCQELRRYIRAYATVGAGTTVSVLTVRVRGYKQVSCL